MPLSLTRRALLGSAAATPFGIALAGNVSAIAGPPAFTGYGALVPDPAGLLSLPAGFSYKVVAQSGVTTCTDGSLTASDPDGTGVFRKGRGSVLVNNHELNRTIAQPPGPERFGLAPLPGLTYDPGARGGTSNIEVDGGGNRIAEYTSLAGTVNNCAGGKTPWRTWLTCEETEVKAGGALQHDHGYVFEVEPLSQEANLDKSPVPLKFLGRFAHEAVAVNPRTDAIFLTEDATAPNGLFYRWLPPKGFRGAKGALGALAKGADGTTAGRLQAMCCFDEADHVPDLSLATAPGTRYKVRWVDVPDRGAGTTPVRSQLSDDQVTRSRKLEGAWWGRRGAYFVASFARSADGSAREHDGQVWRYDPRTRTVTLVVQFGVNTDPASDVGNYDGPDNITVSPYGGLILAEDGQGLQHLVGVTRSRTTYPLARNDLNGSEFAGPCFSADRKTLFAAIYSPGYVFAITGPWQQRPAEAAS